MRRMRAIRAIGVIADAPEEQVGLLRQTVHSRKLSTEGQGSPAAAFAGAALQFGTHGLSGIPDISPIFGDLEGLPPTQLVVGSLDVLLDSFAIAGCPRRKGPRRC